MTNLPISISPDEAGKPPADRPDYRQLVIVGAIAAVGLVAIRFNDYAVTLVGFAAIYVIFVTGLNVFMGYTGQPSFGHNAFAAIGGYATAVLTTRYGFSTWTAMLCGVSLASGVAWLLAAPTLRLRGHYLAVGTMALGMISFDISGNWDSFTGGYTGISAIPPLSIFGLVLKSQAQQAILICVLALIGLWADARIRESRFGRALVAISGSEDAARTLGVDVAHYKCAAFVISAFYSAIAGALLAHFVSYISPEVFGPNMVILGFTMLYVGGIGTTLGPLVGAALVTLLPELLHGFADIRDLTYGLLLIGILLFASKGLVPVLLGGRRARR